MWTVCISGKKVRAVICVLLCVAAAAAAIVFIRSYLGSRTITVFNETEYTEILNETLPTEDKGFKLTELLKKIAGFDTDKPETVIAKFSSVFEENEDDIPAPSENPQSPQITEAPKSEPKTDNPPGFPTKAQINAGAGLEISNQTTYSVNLKELCAQELAFTVEKISEPQVLIVHTHTTECFNGDAMNGETERSTDEEKNMIAVGNVIADVLESNGIHCVHDKTVHDYPSYQGSYTRALSTIDYNLKHYPSIKIVLDVHRDAYVYPDGSKLTVSCEQNGVPTAKVMLVLGTDSLGLSHPKWRENLTLAAKLQSTANIMYPGMMRPINLRRERFNMHMTTGSLLLEIGSNGNSLAEAKEGGKNIAAALSAVLTAN